jgi:hypothetical protein
MTPRVAEATAPCRVDLAGGVGGVLTVTVAIDRRAWCRVETGVSGVLLESRDTLRKAGGRDLAEVLEKGILAPVARVLQAMGVETGVHVVTQSRVPEGSGLGEWAAVGAAVAGAVARGLGQEIGLEDAARLAREAEPPEGEGSTAFRDGHTAVLGGALALHPEEGKVRAEVLSVDPARIEESLLLVQGARSPLAGPGDLSVVRDVATRVSQALLAGRWEEVVGLWAEEWESRRGPARPSAESTRVAGIVREAGGGTRLCAGSEGSFLAVWAPPGARGPGRREAVLQAAKAAGLPVFPARVDLRGLDVE